jgi:hypothetical protein
VSPTHAVGVVIALIIFGNFGGITKRYRKKDKPKARLNKVMSLVILLKMKLQPKWAVNAAVDIEAATARFFPWDSNGPHAKECEKAGRLHPIQMSI